MSFVMPGSLCIKAWTNNTNNLGSILKLQIIITKPLPAGQNLTHFPKTGKLHCSPQTKLNWPAWPIILCRICIHLRCLQQMSGLSPGQRNIVKDKTSDLDFNRSLPTALWWLMRMIRSDVVIAVSSVVAHGLLWSDHSWGKERFSCWYHLECGDLEVHDLLIGVPGEP